MNLIKVVIDTNVFISGIFWSGNSYKILDLWRKGYLKNYTTLSIMSEIVEVLRDFRIKMTEEDVYSWYKLIGENSVILNDNILFSSSVRDVKDNKFIQCALSGKTDYIITQDLDLLVLQTINGIIILTPKIILKKISDGT